MGQQITPPSSAPTEPATPPNDQAPAAPAGQADPFAGIQTEGRTPAEIEAEYRARLGGHQRGWNAAEQALRAQLETAQRERDALLRQSSPSAGGQQGDGAADPRIAELQRQAEEATQRATAAERMAKFPSLAAVIADPQVFAALDEAHLSKMAALVDDNVGATGTFIAPTAPRRTAVPPAPPKPYSEMSKQELEAKLAQVAPVVAAQERQRLGGSGF